MSRIVLRSFTMVALGSLFMLFMAVDGGVAFGQSLEQAAQQQMQAFESKLPADARQFVIRPFSPSNSRFIENRQGYVWRLDFGRRLSSGLKSVLRVEFVVWRMPNRQAAIDLCRRDSGHASGATVSELAVPGRLRGYECTRAWQEISVERQKLASGMTPYGWNTRYFQFSRGLYVVAVYEHAITDDVDNVPAPAFLSQPPVDEIADRLDALTSGAGKPRPAEASRDRSPGRSDGVWTQAEQAAAHAMAASLAALGVTALVTLLLRVRAGLPRNQNIEDLMNALKGRLPPDPFEAWKAKYTGLGWRYAEKNGVAQFEPVAGSRNEQGWIYDAALGEFAAPGAPVSTNPVEGQVDPATGRVWSSNAREWQSRAYYDQERARVARFEAGLAAERQAASQADRAASAAWSARTGAMAHDIALQQQQMEAQKAAEQQQLQLLQAKLTKAYEAEGKSTGQISELAKSGDTGGLANLYKDHLRNVIDTENAKAQSEANWATAYDAGYYTSKFVLAGAKTAMVVASGPAGWTAAAAGSGVIRAVEEGAQTYVETGGNVARTVKSTAGGFVCGVKDGLVSRYTNLPGVGPATKVLLPAAFDAGEAYVRTGKLAEAAKTGLVSAGSGVVGGQVGGVRNVFVREGAQAVLGGATGAVSSAMSGGSAKEGFVEGLVNAVGGSAGGRAGNVAARSTATRVDGEAAPLTPRETQLNDQAAANRAKGRALVDDYKAARTREERADATKAILEDRDAKLLMKGDSVDDSLKSRFAGDTDRTRTQPLLERTAERLNSETTADGKPRFIVQEQDPANPGRTIERPVEASDFKSGSGTKGGGPGQDLDMYTDKKILDTSTGRQAKADVIDGHISGACSDVGISRTRQEVNFVHETHAEAFKMRPGETPQEFIARARSLSGGEGQSVSEVNRHKLAEATILHDPAGAVGEQCRTAIKDYDRLTKPLLDSHPNARVPNQFRVVDKATGETPFDIMRQVGEGKLLPGDGNARFRALTGMSLEDGAVKMSGWAEGIAKGGGPESHLIAGASSREIAQAAMREAMRREALRQL